MSDNFEIALKSLSQQHELSILKTVRMINHITGLADDSVQHYWPNQCDGCKEIAAFLERWHDTARGLTLHEAKSGGAQKGSQRLVEYDAE